MSKAYVMSFNEMGPPVDIGGGIVLPAYCQVTYTEHEEDPRASKPVRPPLAATLALRMKLVDGVLIVTHLGIQGSDDAGQVTPELLRSIRLREIIERVAGSAAISMSSSGSHSTNEDDFDRTAQAAARSRRAMTPALLNRVAQVVRNNPDQPTKQVAEQLFMSHRNATRWIAEAKRKGLLKEES